MNEIVTMVLACIAGSVLGTLFFGGLWFTVKMAVSSKIPALWFFGSFLLRVSITLIGFYYITFGNWQRLLVCLLGFIAVRFIVMHFTRSNEAKQLQLNKEISHEA